MIYILTENKISLFLVEILLQAGFRAKDYKIFETPDLFEKNLIAKKLKLPILWNRSPKEKLLISLNEVLDSCQKDPPKLFILFGNTPLWAFTQKEGISKWQGSNLSINGIPAIPVYSTESIQKNWKFFYPTLLNLKKAKKISQGFAPKTCNFENIFAFQAQMFENFVKEIPPGSLIALDIETQNKTIICFSIAHKREKGKIGASAERERAEKIFCIAVPFVNSNGETFFSLEDETKIILSLRQIFKTCTLIGQNFSYDLFYLLYFYCLPLPKFFDTMAISHTFYSGAPKSLAFLSSILLEDHVYWKDDGREWTFGLPLEQELIYNCTDSRKTLEIFHLLPKENDQTLFQHQLIPQVVKTMLRGINLNLTELSNLKSKLLSNISKLEDFLSQISNMENFWWNSPQKTVNFLLSLGLVIQVRTKKDFPSVDDESLLNLSKNYPHFRQMFAAILQIRTFRIFLKTLQKLPDLDGRARSNLNPFGTITFRFSSSAGGIGTVNLQNISDGSPAARPFPVPSLRKIFIPDPGKLLVEIDLKGADALIVFAEAGEFDMCQKFHDPKFNLHLENARTIFGGNPEKSTDPTSPYHMAKMGVHASNYGCSPRTLAKNLNISISQAENFQEIWFTAHPNIRKWQEKVKRDFSLSRKVTNKWGFSCTFFSRIEHSFPEALAAIPQSTVGITINKIWLNLSQISWIEILLQVHDSLLLQIPIEKKAEFLSLKHLMEPEIPYPQKITIPISIKTGPNWNDLENC